MYEETLTRRDVDFYQRAIQLDAEMSSKVLLEISKLMLCNALLPKVSEALFSISY